MLCFGPYQVTGAKGQLVRRTKTVPLSPKAVAVLWELASRAGQLVSKDALLAAVWPDTVVSEGVLTGCIREVRRALGETIHCPRYIETVHRRGYRFIGAVSGQRSAPSPLSLLFTTQHLTNTTCRWWVARRSWRSSTSSGTRR